MDKIEEIYGLELGGIVVLPSQVGEWAVLRVPGGWIFTREGGPGTTSTFVPLRDGVEELLDICQPSRETPEVSRSNKGWTVGRLIDLLDNMPHDASIEFEVPEFGKPHHRIEVSDVDSTYYGDPSNRWLVIR